MKLCLICSKNTAKIVRKIKGPWSNLKYSLYSCLSCGSEFCDINEHPVDREQLYNEIAPEVVEDFIKSPYWSREVQDIKKCLKRPLTRALDVGCRDGAFLMHYDSSVDKFGVELSLDQAQLAKSRGLNIYTEPIEEVYEIKNTKFDVVSCYAVLEHIPKPLPVIDSLCSYVETEGALVVLIPTHQSLKAKLLSLLGRPWHQHVPPSHLNFFGTSFLVKHIEDQGFRLQKKKYTTGGLGFNPFKSVPILGGLISRTYFFLDGLSLFNRLPIYDHLYLYFKKEA